MWQFSEAVDGMTEACAFFDTPITGGNVSFYNETFGDDIYPTPVLGMVGLVDDLSLVTRSSFQDAGDSIVMIETLSREVGKVNLEDERAIQNLVSAAIRDRLVKSAHDVSEGGLAVALAECCYSNVRRAESIGAEIRIPSHLEVRKDLFGEFATRVVVTTTEPAKLIQRAGEMGLNGHDIGLVGGKRLIFNYEGELIIDVAIDDLESAWRQALAKLL
jgi:phosphoribosylformylglycinamidine synthase